MRAIELPLPLNIQHSSVEYVVERTCSDVGLQISLRGTLASHPDSLHWHFKRAGERGTLEITFAPRTARLWLSVHAGREAAWIEEVLRTLPSRIRRELERAVSEVSPPPGGHHEEGCRRAR